MNSDVIRILGVDTDKISDGYHTFGELYEHRIRLWITLCEVLHGIQPDAWRSRLHSDGTSFPGWFVLGWRQAEGQQITYHLPDSYWSEADFATTLDRAPVWDGHTASDVLTRLRKVIQVVV